MKVKCPKCKTSDAVVPIMYGMPGPEMQQDYYEGKIKLGGCTMDVNNLIYTGEFMYETLKYNGDKETITDGEPTCVINTSCEHMDNTWFDNLPEGQAVALQTNDYFDNDQHVNCCKGLEEVKNKYKFSTILYEGSLDTVLYERYMLIGIK